MSTDVSDKPATAYPEIFQALTDPFERSEVKVRTGGGGRQFHYITARTAMNRLDRVLGPENWEDEYRRWNDDAVFCRITITLPDGRKVSKEAIGGRAQMDEGDADSKSAESDAFKRVCVKLGIGRYLYKDGVASFDGEHGTPESAAATDAPSLNNGFAPTSGRALFAWVKEQQETTGVRDLLSHVNAWGKVKQFPDRLVEWASQQVAEGHAECVRHLMASKAKQLPAKSEDADESRLFESLPNAPTSGKGLFAATKELEGEHTIELIEPTNKWAKSRGVRTRMVEWEPAFVAEAWLFVSAIVRKNSGEVPSTQNISGQPAPDGSVKGLRDEFLGWLEGVVCKVHQVPNGVKPGRDQMRAECNTIAGMVQPGWTISSIADLTDADDLKRLIGKARERFEEVDEIPF